MLVRSALVLALALLAAAPASASAAFGVESRFELVAPPNQPAFAHAFAADTDGSVYVLWQGLVQRYTPSGALVQSWGSFGSGPGDFTPPARNLPSTLGIAVDGLGNLYVADHSGNRLVKFTTTGAFVSNLGGLAGPERVDVDAAGNLIVAENPYPAGDPASIARVRRLTPGGATLGSSLGWYVHFAPGPGDRLYVGPGGLGEVIARYEGPSFASYYAFTMLFGDQPDDRGVYSSSCCGIAFVGDRVWVARNPIRAIEAYGPDGGFLASCPAGDWIRDLRAGRDGRLYALTGSGTVIRYGDAAAAPCDTDPPAVTDMQVTKTLRASSYRRLRHASLYASVSEQGSAELTFIRLVDGRRVKGRCRRPTRRNRRRPPCTRGRKPTATFGGIKASVPDGLRVRFVDLLWRKRLPVGRYELALVATDRAGHRSAPVTARVRVTR